MPRARHLLRSLGGLVFLLGVSKCLPLLVSVVVDDGAQLPLLGAVCAALLAGGATFKACGTLRDDYRIREGFAVVGIGYVLLSAFAALPFYFWATALDDHEFHSFASCYFEASSGLTATGASILGAAGSEIEALPKSLLFWRLLTHWLGGMGIIVLAVALLPLLGTGIMQLFKAEVPGQTIDKVAPRIQETAKLLYIVYALLTAVVTVLLWLSPEMGLFDALCHAFSTMATGGFSTKDDSLVGYGSYVQWVVIGGMLVAGSSFTFHFHLLRSGRISNYWRSEEFRVYILLVAAASAWVTYELHVHGPREPTPEAARHAIFQVLAVITTTGFAVADYSQWPGSCQTVLFLLMFSGACTGSTSGGIKIIRHVVLARATLAQTTRLLHPRAFTIVRLNGRPLDRSVVATVHAFLLIYLLLVAAGTIVLGTSPADEKVPIDVLTAVGSALACVSNVGPSFGLCGPMENYSCFSGFGKWTCSLLMIAGRLELFTIFVLLKPGFWRSH